MNEVSPNNALQPTPLALRARGSLAALGAAERGRYALARSEKTRVTSVLAVISLAVLLSAGCKDRAPRPTTARPSDQTPAQVSPVSLDPYIEWNLPPWVHDALRTGGYRERYDLFTGLNPYYQRGRFDGDDRSDIAVLIREKATGKRGIAIIHRATGSVVIIGAGQPFGNGGHDFSWLGVWRVADREGAGDASPPSRDMLYVEKAESAGGIISWDGTKYVWTQAGD